MDGILARTKCDNICAMYVFLNGKFIKKTQAKISAFDAGFLYGDGIYETMRFSNGKTEDLELHFKRLCLSAEILIGRLQFKKVQFANWIKKLVSKNKLKEARIRVTVSGSKTILIVAEKLKKESAKVYKEGVKAVTYQIERVLPEIKITNLAPQMIARNYMKKKNAYEVLLVDRDSYVREGSVTNVFIVKNGILMTPEKRILKGIIRGRILEIAKKIRIPVKLCDIPVDELMKADEVFITNSIKGVVPVVQVDGHKIGHGQVGEITARIRQEII